MNIIEKSKEYAKGKALEAISTAIEQAYEAGYNDGMRHRENELLESMKEDVEFKDLALPSGTLWSSTYIIDKNYKTEKRLPYSEASKLSLPTKEQFEELFSNCATDDSTVTIKRGIRITGVNGQEIELSFVHVSEISIDLGYEYIAFWLKDDEGKTKKAIARVNSSGKIIETKFFMGYKLPVMLVKSKE